MNPTASEMLDFLAMLSSWPYAFWMDGPPNSREKGSEWLLSYGPKGGSNGEDVNDGTVYAPSKKAVIVKAMKLFRAQEEAARLIAEAKA